MSEVVERLARAIQEKMFAPHELPITDPWLIERYRETARAAIDALREPTEAMADAGGAAFLDATIAHESGDKTNRPFVRFWRAMIDEARRERPANAPEAPKGTSGTST